MCTFVRCWFFRPTLSERGSPSHSQTDVLRTWFNSCWAPVPSPRQPARLRSRCWAGARTEPGLGHAGGLFSSWHPGLGDAVDAASLPGQPDALTLTRTMGELGTGPSAGFRTDFCFVACSGHWL